MRLVALMVNDDCGFNIHCIITLTLLQGMPFMPPLVLVLELSDLTIPDRDIHACSGSLENRRKKREDPYILTTSLSRSIKFVPSIKSG